MSSRGGGGIGGGGGGQHEGVRGKSLEGGQCEHFAKLLTSEKEEEEESEKTEDKWRE